MGISKLQFAATATLGAVAVEADVKINVAVELGARTGIWPFHPRHTKCTNALRFCRKFHQVCYYPQSRGKQLGSECNGELATVQEFFSE